MLLPNAPLASKGFLLIARWWHLSREPRDAVGGAELGARLEARVPDVSLLALRGDLDTLLLFSGSRFLFPQNEGSDQNSGVHRMVPGPTVSTSGNLLETQILTPFKTC